MGLGQIAGRELAGPGRLQAQASARRRRGFTLIELMITVAIVAVLAAVAYPAYTSHLRKGNRAAAQAYLMDLAQKQTQYLLDNRAYATSESALGATMPTEVAKFYQSPIGFNVPPSATPPTFTLTATPIVGSSQASDGPLTIDQAGQKTPSDKW